MKSFIYILLSLTLSIPILHSQQKDSLIQLYPGLGDTLDSFDRNYFELFQNIEGFEYAVFYIRDNKYLVSNVTCTKEGLSQDTVFVQNVSALGTARSRIEQIENENNKNIEMSRECIVVTNSGTRFKAKLEMFSKKNLYLVSNQHTLTVNPTELKFKLPIQNLDSLIFLAQSNVMGSVGWGALIGLAIGGGLGLLSGGDPKGFLVKTTEEAVIFWGVIGIVIGSVIGLIAGLGSSSGDEIIEIDSQYDVLALKGDTKYYFRYDESIDQRFKKIE